MTEEQRQTWPERGDTIEVLRCLPDEPGRHWLICDVIDADPLRVRWGAFSFRVDGEWRVHVNQTPFR